MRSVLRHTCGKEKGAHEGSAVERRQWVGGLCRGGGGRTYVGKVASGGVSEREAMLEGEHARHPHARLADLPRLSAQSARCGIEDTQLRER